MAIRSWLRIHPHRRRTLARNLPGRALDTCSLEVDLAISAAIPIITWRPNDTAIVGLVSADGVKGVAAIGVEAIAERRAVDDVAGDGGAEARGENPVSTRVTAIGNSSCERLRVPVQAASASLPPPAPLQKKVRRPSKLFILGGVGDVCAGRSNPLTPRGSVAPRTAARPCR